MYNRVCHPDSYNQDYWTGTLTFSHCNSFEDWVHINFIDGYPIFNWTATTDKDERVPVLAMAAKWQAPFSYNYWYKT